MNNIDELVKTLAPLMELPGRRISRKIKMEHIDKLLPIEKNNSAMFRHVTKSIESLRSCITLVADSLNGFDEYTAEDAYHIRFRLNCRIIAILIGSRLHKRAKDDCYVFDSFFLFNQLPDVAEIMNIYNLYHQFINEIAAKFPIDAPYPSMISSIEPQFNAENLTNEKLQNTISYALNKNITLDDLLTIVSMAKQLRDRNRRRAALGVFFVAVAVGGAAFLIHKNSKNDNESSDRKKLKDKTNNDSESNNTKTLQDKTCEDVLIHVEDDYLNKIEYEEEASIEDCGIEESLKYKTPTDDLSQQELDYIGDYEYWDDYTKRDDELYNMLISEYEEIRRCEDYGLDDEEMYVAEY